MFSAGGVPPELAALGGVALGGAALDGAACFDATAPGLPAVFLAAAVGGALLAGFGGGCGVGSPASSSAAPSSSSSSSSSSFCGFAGAGVFPLAAAFVAGAAFGLPPVSASSSAYVERASPPPRRACVHMRPCVHAARVCACVLVSPLRSMRSVSVLLPRRTTRSGSSSGLVSSNSGISPTPIPYLAAALAPLRAPLFFAAAAEEEAEEDAAEGAAEGAAGAAFLPPPRSHDIVLVDDDVDGRARSPPKPCSGPSFTLRTNPSTTPFDYRVLRLLLWSTVEPRAPQPRAWGGGRGQ